MTQPGRASKILLIDSNVLFAKRLGEALKREGFEVIISAQAAFGLTTLEYDTPAAILCGMNMRDLGALELAQIVHADPKNASLPVIAIGDGNQRALMEAFQAGCEDYVDRRTDPSVIAAHIRSLVITKRDGFRPTQMLQQSETTLTGSLSHQDLPGVVQLLQQARQTGALHINAMDLDAVMFFDGGEIAHAETGNLFGDEAVIYILKTCTLLGTGVYKFNYGSAAPQRTVLRSSTDLLLDAMREIDESQRDMADKEAL
jgi:DNA-binding response OmpR family regulator